MKNLRGMIPLFAILALLLASGCKTVGQALLSAFETSIGGSTQTTSNLSDEEGENSIKKALGQAVAQLIITATNQASQQTINAIVSGLQQLVQQNTSSTTQP